MYVTQSGEKYGFCPGKATWDESIVSLYQTLLVSTETGVMYEDGPLSKQPAWWMDLLTWFVPMYRDKVFWSRANLIMGSMSGDKAAPSNGNKK